VISRRYRELQMMRRQSRGNREAQRESSRSRGRTADPALERRAQDFGFMTTDAEAIEVRKALDFSEHEKASKKLSSAMGKLSAFEGKNIKDIDSVWGSARDKFTTVGIYNGNSLEGTYRLPKDIVDKLHGGSGGAINAGENTYTGRWKGDNRYNVDVVVSGIDEARGKELHEMFGSAESDVKTQFYEEYGKKINDNNARIRDAAADARSQIEGQQAVIAADKGLTEDALAQKQQHYQDIKAKSYAAAQSMGTRGGNE